MKKYILAFKNREKITIDDETAKLLNNAIKNKNTTDGYASISENSKIILVINLDEILFIKLK